MRIRPAPPSAVFEALTQPDRDPTRSWLRLLGDEIVPDVKSEPDASPTGHLRKRTDELITANLRYSFGQ